MATEQANQFTCTDCGARTDGELHCNECHAKYPRIAAADGNEVSRLARCPIEREPNPTPAPPATPAETPLTRLEITKIVQLSGRSRLVIHLPHRFEPGAVRNIRASVEAEFPGERCVVMCEGLELKVEEC